MNVATWQISVAIQMCVREVVTCASLSCVQSVLHVWRYLCYLCHLMH